MKDSLVTPLTARIFRALDSQMQAQFKVLIYDDSSGRLAFPTLGRTRVMDFAPSEYPEQTSCISTPEIRLRYLSGRGSEMEEAALHLAFRFWELVLPEHNTVIVRNPPNFRSCCELERREYICSMCVGLGTIQVLDLV